MKFIDMFCGIGTVRMGFEMDGHECVYSIEWDKWKRKIYSIIFGGEPEGGDITKCKANELPKSDCWCFGAPCQDFSIAGKRAGLEGDRSSMVREVFRLLWELEEEHRPEWLLYENVKGMLSSNKGFDFFEILFEMEKLGYDCEWQVLNSKNFGVPQNRERVFIIGHLRGRGTRKVFPITETNGHVGVPISRVAHSKYYRRVLQTYEENSSIEALDTMQGGNRQPCVMINNKKPKLVGGLGDINFGKQFRQGNRIYDANEIAMCLNAQPVGNAGGSSYLYKVGCKIRKLTPKECWRLQGIPDEITDKVIVSGISNTQMYRGAGDACTVNVIYEIARRLK